METDRAPAVNFAAVQTQRLQCAIHQDLVTTAACRLLRKFLGFLSSAPQRSRAVAMGPRCRRSASLSTTKRAALLGTAMAGYAAWDRRVVHFGVHRLIFTVAMLLRRAVSLVVEWWTTLAFAAMRSRPSAA